MKRSVPRLSPILSLVTHIVPALFRKDGGLLGGGERYVLELARHMAPFVPTRLVTFGPKAEKFRDGELEICILRSWWNVRGQVTNPISPEVLTAINDASVVHCHQKHVLATSLVAAACRLRSKPVFVTDLGGGGWDLSAYVSTDRLFTAELHISDYSRSLAAGAMKLPQEVILGGVDTMKFSPNADTSSKAGLVFVGRLLPHKGIDVLLEALPANIPLTICGQIHDDVYLRELHTLTEGKSVRWVHDADDEEIIRGYRHALAVILPSVYRSRYGPETRVPELLGQTLLEGMACGTAAICTQVASLPEIVRDGEDGFVVPPNDPKCLTKRLAWLIENRDCAVEMGRSARARVLEKFQWSDVVDRCLKAYGLRRRETMEQAHDRVHVRVAQESR